MLEFASGGSGVGYVDATPGNNGGVYRDTDVDIEPSQEGGHNVGWIGAGEWLKYTVSTPSAGLYTIEARVASDVLFQTAIETGQVHSVARVIGQNGRGVTVEFRAEVTGDHMTIAVRAAFLAQGPQPEG